MIYSNISYIVTIHEHRSSRRIVKSLNQFHDRALSTAALTHERHTFATRYFQVKIL